MIRPTYKRGLFQLWLSKNGVVLERSFSVIWMPTSKWGSRVGLLKRMFSVLDY